MLILRHEKRKILEEEKKPDIVKSDLGFALAVVPGIWDSMDAKQRTNVETWLGNSINEKK